jgi:hypothetical protein
MSNEQGTVHIRFGGVEAHRRAFLRAAAVATGGVLITVGRDEASGQVIAPGHRGMPSAQDARNFPAAGAFDGLFQAPTATTVAIPERKNIAALPDAELTNLRDAFRTLGAPAGSIYQSWVQLHVNSCQHNNDLIWPWHRAYLYYFEKRLQRANPSADPPVTIPYWAYDTEGADPDTAESRRLPVPFRADTVGGMPNPLFVRDDDGERFAGVNEGQFELPSVAVATADIISSSPDFFTFGTSLENGPHNYVHNNLGTTMGNRQFSPNDPIFWLHHSNLDWAWVRWEGSDNHAEPQPPANQAWLDTTLPGFSQFPTQFPLNRVGQFLDLTQLGYTYVLDSFSIALDLRREMMARSPALDFARAVKPPATPGTRPVAIRFRDVELPKTTVLEVRVFLNRPNANAETPLTDPGLAGVLTFYPPHAGHGPIPKTVTVELVATRAVQRLLAENPGTTRFPVTAVVVPSRRAAAEAQAETLKYKSIDVVIRP